MEEEQTLITRAREEPEVLGTLYERYVDRLYAYAVHCLHDPAAAEDVVAETFQQALEHLPRYEWRGVPLSAWLYRIASNVIAGRYRRAPLLPLDAIGEVPDDALGPEGLLLRWERRCAVRDAVARLPPLQRQAVALRYGQELPYAEIALILGRSEGTVKQLVHRARRTLQRHLAVGRLPSPPTVGARAPSQLAASGPTHPALHAVR